MLDKNGEKYRQIAVLVLLTMLLQCFLTITSASLADGTTKLVGRWKFEEGAGNTDADTSGITM